jgi:hypothetical protein
MVLWVIGYGIIQAPAPALRRSWGKGAPKGMSTVQFWRAVLLVIHDNLAEFAALFHKGFAREPRELLTKWSDNVTAFLVSSEQLR